MTELPTGTVTFLIADVEGSTRLVASMGEAYGDLLADVRALVREAVAAHDGIEVDAIGDEVFAVFARTGGAVDGRDRRPARAA